MKPIIGFDLDGVLYPWHDVAYRFAVENFNVSDDYSTFWCRTIHELHPNKQKFLIGDISSYTSVIPDQQLLNLLNDISKEYGFIYVTARPKDAYLNTKFWLEKFRFPNCEYLFFEKDKTIPVRTYRCKYFVEDSPDHLSALRYVTTPILFQQPWNETVRAKYICINSIEQLKEIVLK